MTFEQIIRAAVPNASKADVEHILWERTPFPMGAVSARSLYKAASRARRASTNGRMLCELCDRLADDGWCCKQCNKALADAAAS